MRIIFFLYNINNYIINNINKYIIIYIYHLVDWYHHHFDYISQLVQEWFSLNKKKFAKLVTFASQLTVLLDAHVEDVDSLVRVYPANVGPHVRRVFGPVRTIGTVESWQLTALELEVIIQIVLACKYVAALVARITLVLTRAIGIIDALG